MFIFLTGCRGRIYDGEYPELFSVAIHSLLGARGYEVGHHNVSGIGVLEEDDHGRVLFLYSEDSISSRLILQKVDGDYAYFYPYYNFILNYGIRPRSAPADFSFGFTEEEIDELKEANSWNQPLSDNSEFERVPIIRLKEEGPVSFEILSNVNYQIFPEATRRGINSNNAIYRMNSLRTDRYGRTVYFASPYAVLLQPDHSFDLETGVLEITDINNYQTELRLFMEANGWNEPWEE